MSSQQKIHEDFMNEALKLAKKGAGFVSPNPMVGAIIIKEYKGRYKIIGRGYHREYGGNHAEIEAIKNCSENPRGASLYVNLEPCCHHGKTGPCTEAIIEAGIREVHIGIKDPNPEVSGKGIQALEKANIKVYTGILKEKCQKLNEIFCKWIQTNKPFLTIKTACTLDGKIALDKGIQTILGNEQSWDLVHKQRQLYDAILVGSNTLLIDNPRLTCRLNTYKVSHPKRIIVDSQLKTPLDAQIFQEDGQNIICCTDHANPDKKAKLEQLKHTQLIVCQSNPSGHVDLKDMVNKLAELKITSILIEGGGTINSAFLNADLVDKINIIYCPIISGNNNAPSIFSIPVKNQLKYKQINQFHLGTDIWWEAYL